VNTQKYILIFFSMVAFTGMASAAILTVTPDQVVIGEPVTVEGNGFGANEAVTLSSSVSDFVITVSGSTYVYRLEDFYLSDSNTLFSLSAREVEDDMTINITTSSWSVQLINKSSGSIFGLLFGYDAANKTASVSTGESPPVDIYKLIEVSGTVSGSATTHVYMNFIVTNNVTANATGYFKSVIDTHGIPAGEYEITADGVNATLNVTAPSTHTLTTGWNLISVPLNLSSWVLGNESVVGDPLNVTPKNSLTSVYRYNITTGSFDKCDHLNDWGWWPATGSESFTALEPGRGYWVRAENECTLTFMGTDPYDLDVTLKQNWNLIGWYSLTDGLLGNDSVVGAPFNVTPENTLTSIYRYNITTGSFDKCDHLDDWGWWPATGSGSFTALEPGRGYWVQAKNACVWRHEV